MQAAAESLRSRPVPSPIRPIPAMGARKEPTGMFDSLALSERRAIVFRRLIASATRRGVIAWRHAISASRHEIALGACNNLPCVLVPGGVPL